MFYEPDKENHGLPFNPFKSITVPRPIGWISTVNLKGRVNLAPYSQFQNIGYDPPISCSAHRPTVTSIQRSTPKTQASS